MQLLQGWRASIGWKEKMPSSSGEVVFSKTSTRSWSRLGVDLLVGHRLQGWFGR